jgi:GDP-L-fucose synthase
MMREYGKRFISAMPTNLYGPNDNYDLDSSHVLPALLRRFHVAKATGAAEVTLWGTGTPLREFLHADDLADACLFLMDNYEAEEHINIGVGHDMPIRDLAELVRTVVGYKGEIHWDSSKPDGTPRKLMDVSRIHALGWRHSIELEDGLRQVYRDIDKSSWV